MSEAIAADSAKVAILRYQPGWSHSVVVTGMDRRLVVGFGFDLERPDAPERIQTLGEDFELVRDGLTSLSEEQMHRLFMAQLEAAVDYAEIRLPGFSQMSHERQAAVLELITSLGESLFHGICAAAEQQDGSELACASAASAWFDDLGPVPFLGLDRQGDLFRGGTDRREPQDVGDIGLGGWARALTRSLAHAEARYRADADAPFDSLPESVQSALALVARDSDGAAGFWDAVTERRWSEAVRVLAELPEMPERSRRQAIMLLERARADGQLPARKRR